jgi:hypothetical protein
VLNCVKLVTVVRLRVSSKTGLNEALDGGLTLLLCLIRSHRLHNDLRLEVCKSVVCCIEADVLCKLKIEVVVHFAHYSIF